MPGRSNTAASDIHDIIRRYREGLDKGTSDILSKLDDAICEYEQPNRFMLTALRTREGNALLLEILVDLIRGWQSRGKGKVANTLHKFAAYLRKNHGINLNEDALPKDIPDVTERRLDMLKFLQTPQTREALESRYLTSERTIRSDLTVLVNGWDIMGSRIRINRIDIGKTITYNSTVHPVLLPLNLTEVYALAAGIPKLAQGTVFEEMARYLADVIGSQLSEHAANIIARSAPDTALARKLLDGLSYRPEEPMLAESRNAWLIYLAKQGMKCRIIYTDPAGDVCRIEGVPSLSHGDFQSIGFRDSEVLVPLTGIVSFEPLEPYQ